MVEPLDEAEECSNGEDFDVWDVFEGDRADDASEFRVHSAVISVTAARAEDSSTIAFLAA